MNIRSQIKNKLQSILPNTFFVLIRKIYIQSFAKIFNSIDYAVVKKYSDKIKEKKEYIVLDGPFKGMHYVEKAIGSSFIPKIAGYYESVLTPYIEEIKTLPIQHILDIGSAEGYYTTGFGHMFPSASISAFEIEDAGRILIQEMYTKNNLTNPLQLLNEATKENIPTEIKTNTLLICDCEGAEKSMLDIENKDTYKDVLYGIIELHDDMVAGCKDAILHYFEKTHTIEIVMFTHADPEKFSFFKDIVSKRERDILLRERGIQDQEWAILRRK